VSSPVSYLDPMQLQPDLSVRDLSEPAEGPYAIQVLIGQAVERLSRAWDCEVRWCRGPRIVPVADNYDRLGYRAEAVTREARYTRYVDAGHLLRSHSSAMIPPALRRLARQPSGDVLLACPGIVYRRDAIDWQHTGTPHQLDLWRITRRAMRDTDLDQMIAILLGALAPGRPHRRQPRTHPYTRRGRQVDVCQDGRWVEVGECGLAHPRVLAAAGLHGRKGQPTAMHVARIRSGYTDKAGHRREYESAYLRRTWRDGGTVRHETVANLSGLGEQTVALIEAALKGAPLVPAGQAMTITRSLPHGHVAAVHAMAAKLGLPALLGPARLQRDLALALVISRVVAPGSKLSTLAWWSDTTLGPDLGVAQVSDDDVYAAMDWLAGRQDAIEAGLARRHLAPEANPSKMALFDLSSSWLEGTHCPLAARGYSRDGKKARLQIEYGLLTDPEGRPVAVRVLTGNTGDPAAFTEIIKVVRDKFHLARMVMVGDRGMITSARISALRELDEDYGWITALRGPAIKKLMADDGPLQLSLFDEQDLAEITSPDFPGERLICCRNPVLAAERARKREDLLAATERLLRPLIDRVAAGRLRGADAIGLAVGKVIGTHKMARHLAVTITDDSLAIERRQDQIEAEAVLDGIYVIRTPVPQGELGAAGVVSAYKNLKYVERDFRHIKADDLDLRPVFHRLTRRVKAHVLICMLAAYLVWHLRRAWAPLTYTDEDPPQQDNPVAPARRPAAAQAKAARKHDQDGRPYHSFRGLLAHLATMTRNQVRFAGTPATVPVLAEPTSEQRQAFDLIGAPIPLALT
jgi:tRNA synthetases class II core domain (F)